jgi:hypothetical protein
MLLHNMLFHRVTQAAVRPLPYYITEIALGFNETQRAIKASSIKC